MRTALLACIDPADAPLSTSIGPAGHGQVGGGAVASRRAEPADRGLRYRFRLLADAIRSDASLITAAVEAQDTLLRQHLEERRLMSEAFLLALERQ